MRVRQRAGACVEGGQCEVRCWEGGEVGCEFDGLCCHLPLGDLRRWSCWRARAVNRLAGGVFHTELAFMKNTRTALPTAPPGPPWRMEKDAWQASSLFVNLNCSRSLTPEGNFAETAALAKGEGWAEGGWEGGEEGKDSVALLKVIWISVFGQLISPILGRR